MYQKREQAWRNEIARTNQIKTFDSEQIEMYDILSRFTKNLFYSKS